MTPENPDGPELIGSGCWSVKSIFVPEGYLDA
jgi:hypothetical protein